MLLRGSSEVVQYAAVRYASTLKRASLGVYPMPATLFDLSGRTALVTGGSKGLGKAPRTDPGVRDSRTGFPTLGA